MQFIQVVSTLLGSMSSFVGALEGLGDVVSAFGQTLDLFVQGPDEGSCNNCPGAESNMIAAAWANIGYVTHAALLHYVNFTNFGKWAIILYVVAAGGALISVALNSPPRNYVWFFLGPAIYSFLIGTTQEVQGVNWVVAGKQMDMREVWRDSETGIRNSPLLQIDKYSGMTVNKKTGPSKEYEVATAMLFLDELFSATTNMLVGWSGLYNQLGEGGANSNLAKSNNAAVEAQNKPWYLLSTLKAPLVENITNARIRNPDLRDAFITFLSSECGESFKEAINSGSYNAATMSRGSKIPQTIMNAKVDPNIFDDEHPIESLDYNAARHFLNIVEIPTPKSLYRLLDSPDVVGSLALFSPSFNSPEFKAKYQKRINCSTYLWTLIQGMRHEMGHAYWQLIRSAPRGFGKQEQVLFTLFYGWNIRQNGQSEYASAEHIKWFTQNLIFTYILKNELEFAPSITALEQKFAPADQTQQYASTYVGNVGSKSKSSELYNWALMMPYVQGILLYVIIVAYPLAAMAMVIPGYWKAFFTWVTFFAWIKMWDVGFAVVQVLERSVWATMGNNSNMARVANMLIQTAFKTSGVGIKCGEGAVGGNTDVMDGCAVPNVASSRLGIGDSGDGQDQKEAEAFFYLDKALLLGASVDLNVANGYYLYIMAALYLAVPAVTGQLILGAKAGLGGLATNALGENAKDISGAAKSGFQGEMANQIMTAREHIGQASQAKSLRSPSNQFLNSLNSSNDAMKSGLQAGYLNAKSSALGNASQAANLDAQSFDMASKTSKAGAGNIATMVGSTAGGGGRRGTNGNGSPTAPTFGEKLGAGGAAVLDLGSNAYNQKAFGISAKNAAASADLSWQSMGNSQKQQGQNAYAKSLGDQGQFQADTAAWEAKNNFAQNLSGAAGVYGVNAGSLYAGNKPTDKMGMAMTGMLSGKEDDIGNAARYSGTGFLGSVEGTKNAGIDVFGNKFVTGHFGTNMGQSNLWNVTPNAVAETFNYTTKGVLGLK